MNANSTHWGRYSTPRRSKPIDPGAFYAVDSWALEPPRLIPEAFTRPEFARRGGKQTWAWPETEPLCATGSTTIMHEEEYNNLQPTYTYPLPLIPTAAPVPGSIFNRHGGSKSNRRGHPAFIWRPPCGI